MKTTVPENLADLSVDDLRKLSEALTAEFDESYEGDADLAVLGEIADALDKVRGATDQKTAEAEQAAADREALRERVQAGTPEGGDDGAGDGDDGAAGDDAGDAGDGGDAGEQDDAGDDAGAGAQEGEVADKELVTAGAGARKAPPAKALSRNRPAAPPSDGDGGVVITAAADIPGIKSGARLDTKGIANAMHARAKSLPNHSTEMPVASIALHHEFSVPESPSAELVASMLDQAASQSRLKDASGNLVAAGGWCVPDETLYDLFEIEGTDGLLDLPTLGMVRGGIQVPSFFGFGAGDEALWTWTEADDIEALDPEGPRKACMRIPCPEFTPYRLELDGLCITHGNLSNAAWPELTARFVRLVVNAHLHRMSAIRTGKIVDDAEAFVTTGISSDAAGDLLSAVDLVVANLRSRYKLPDSAVIETVFPHWTTPMLRSNFAARAGVELTNVTDGDVRAHLATRMVRPQFVHAYQPLVTDEFNVTAWPDELSFLAYVAGSYALGEGPSIDLGVVRDSALNATNDYTAAWSEQSHLVARRGPQAFEVTVPLAVNGVTGCCDVPEV